MKTKKTKTNEFKIDQLQSIREEKNISIEALAETLKVSKVFINYIESGQFEKLGAPTFIKGHVSNYSKAIGLDAKAVIAQVPSHFLQTQSIKPSDAYGVSPLARVRRSSNHFGKYAIGTALLAMLTLSFYFVWDKWSMPNGVNNDALPIEPNTVVEKDLGSKGKNITYSSLIPQVSLSNSAVSTEREADSMEDTTIAVDATTEPAENDVVIDQSEGDDSAYQPPVAEAEELSMISSMALYSIELDLDDQAWVSIKDTAGKKLEHDLIGPGTHQYQSNQPIHFRIGNARMTRVTINNEAINLSEFIKNDIADFSWPKDPS